MENKKELPTFLKLLIFTLVTALVWVFFTIYRSFTQEPGPTIPEEILQPLNPKLDTRTLDEIKAKKYLDQIPDIKIESPQPEEQEEPEEQDMSEEATGEASLSEETEETKEVQ